LDFQVSRLVRGLSLRRFWSVWLFDGWSACVLGPRRLGKGDGRWLDTGHTYIALENWFLVAIIRRVVP
jgi:hypothetical protein